MGINDWLSRRRQATPDREAVLDDITGRRYSYADLDQRATRVAQHLRHQLGILPYDRVACLTTNRIEAIDLYFACGKLGAILVPLNHRLPAGGLLELLDDCQPKLLIYESQFADVAAAAERVSKVWCIDPSTTATAEPSVSEALTDELAVGQAFEAHDAEETDVAMILYTSGTTGRAKGAMISYRQIHWNALNTIIGLRLTEHDTSFMHMPLYHTGGWHVLFTPLMLLGGRVVLQAGFDAQRCNELLCHEGITILFGIPTTLRMMAEAENFAAADFSCVRYAIFGGESCPLPLIETYSARGVAMRQGYGLTEAGPNCFSLPAQDAVRKQGSIGFPNFLVDARLCRDDGTLAEVGEVGELQMRGPHVFAGYWNNPQATTEVLQDGWLATGDLMTRDDEGYYFVVGRKKEMYVSGGENVYPPQVERTLQEHEAVASAAVVGVADPKWGEAGWAFVQLHSEAAASEAELRTWCEQHLARFQCPKQIVLVDQLPLGSSGKIDKRVLTERAAQQAKP